MEELASYAIPSAESIMYLTGTPNSLNPTDLMDTAGMRKPCIADDFTPQLNPDVALHFPKKLELSLDPIKY